MSAPRPYHEWTEEVGDVLWWLWPIVDAPYCGTPMDLGYTVEIDLGIASSQRTFEPVETKRSIQIGGWPFDERDDNEGYHRLFWTELPNFDALDVEIRDCIRGGLDEPQPRGMKEHEHG